MRFPMPPPPLESIVEKFKQLGVERLMEIMTHQKVEVTSDPYIPWDKLRYKKPPAGLNHEEWWLVTKLGRQGLQRKIPLKDKNGQNFTYALPDEALKAIEEVNRYLS